MTALFRPSRERRTPDPWLPHKMLLFAIAAGFAVAGIVSGRGWLINIAIVALAIGLVLRILGARRDEHAGGDDPPSGI